MAASYRTGALPCRAPWGDVSTSKVWQHAMDAIASSKWTRRVRLWHALSQLVGVRGRFSNQSAGGAGSAAKNRVLGSGAPIELRRVASGIGVGRSTAMSMTATLGIKALIATITAAFSSAGRAYRAILERSPTPPAVARRAQRRPPRALRISRQTGRVPPEYLPALARSRLLRLRGLH